MVFWRKAAGIAMVLAMAGISGRAVSGAPAESPATILDTHSAWRIYEVLKPPVVKLDAGIKPITSSFQWLDRDTPAVAEGWASRDFSDATWLQATADGQSRTPYLANVYERARFDVADPAAVTDMKLTVTYQGGVIVLLNGKEIGRGSLPKDAAPALADDYPASAFVTDADVLVGGGRGNKASLAVRERKLDLTVPASALVKGTNVLAIEGIRSAYDKSVYDYWKRNAAKDHREGFAKDPTVPYDLNWNTCEIQGVTLTAGGAVVTNAARPKQMQAWNGDLLHADYPSDLGDRCAPLRAVAIEGPRNGWSSGKVVIGSPKAIDGLKVTCGDLTMAPGGAVIPASAMRARYGISFAERGEKTPLDCLLESPLASFPASRGGCVVPIWFTVKVPASAKPGAYSGQATIEAAGEKPLTVPITLQVSDFTEPNTQDYHTWIELMESPDTLAAEYKVPLWSDQHWDLIRQSMRYIGEIGSRVVYVPLIAQTNSGNSQSMVRWIKKPDGTYSYDFSIMDKYLDYAQKYMGKPKFVVFTTWEIYLDTPKTEVKVTAADQKDAYRAMEKSWLAARWDLRGKGPAVTALDPATGQVATVNLPRFEDPAARPLWKPLFDELHKKMAARGLENTMLLGMSSDAAPTRDETATLEEVSGGLPWIRQTHGGSRVGAKIGGIGKVAYTAYVWNTQYAGDPSKGRMYGWQNPDLYVEFRRFNNLNDWPASTMMLLEELEITGAQRGLGRIGADFWPVLKDKRGERRGWIWNQYPQSLWHSCNLMSHLLDPGPTGPVATSRYELMREGIQQCEARIAIEKVLTDPTLKAKLGAALATRAQKLLDDRIWQELKAFGDLQLTGRMYTTSAKNVWFYNGGGMAGNCWYAGSGWQQEAQELYDTAAEVAAKAGE